MPPLPEGSHRSPRFPRYRPSQHRIASIPEKVTRPLAPQSTPPLLLNPRWVARQNGPPLLDLRASKDSLKGKPYRACGLFSPYTAFFTSMDCRGLKKRNPDRREHQSGSDRPMPAAPGVEGRPH
jgi:hypothetical protein